MAKFNREDVLEYGTDRYFIIDVVTDFIDREFYLCCECTLDGKLDFSNVVVFDITYDESNEEMIRMVNAESEVYRDVLLYELDNAMMDLYPEYKEKVEEFLNMEEE